MDMKPQKKQKGFSRPHCAECGAELDRQPTAYEAYQVMRVYCKECQPVADVKENWRPLGAGTVSRIFFVSDRKPPTVR
jgi:hypothetical protein